MLSNFFQKSYLLVIVLINISGNLLAQGPDYCENRQKEYLNRGLVAIKDISGNVNITWRLLPKDGYETYFDVYRKEKSGKEKKLNSSPITSSTYFIDSTFKSKNDVKYIVRKNGVKNIEPGAEYNLTRKRAEKPYISIPMSQIPGDSLWTYAPNDATIIDVDGDGEFEIILMRLNDGKDNSHKGICRGTVIIECYKISGEMLWRIDLGPNIRGGAHYTQMIAYDFNGDGKGELVLKTAEGTKFGDGMIIGDTNNDGITDYVDRNQDSPTYGKIVTGPEFLSIIDGETGKELARENFIPRGDISEWGDITGNRVDRFLGGIGFLDDEKPSIIISRGYYAKTVIEAWDYRNNQLIKKWSFSTIDNNGKYKDYEGQGNHNLSIGDVDGDGKDEIIFGACMIDHDGTGGYNTKLGHGDAIHLTNIDIDRKGLEVWTCHEETPSRAGSELRDAATGELLWGIPAVEDVGRAMTADIDPRFRGCEVWSTGSNGVYTADGKFICSTMPPVNMAIWWDGTLNRELLDGKGGRFERNARIFKWNTDKTEIYELPDNGNIMMNNGTKSNPSLCCDLIGDWREELLVRTKDNKELRIYITDFPTDYRFFSLMSDQIYRNSIATQNIGYNQPSHTGFYLGSDLGEFWNKKRFYEKNRKRNNPKYGLTNDGKINGMNERLNFSFTKPIKDILCYNDSINIDLKFDYEDYCIKVDNVEIKADRYITLKRNEYDENRAIPLEIKVYYHGATFFDIGSVTFVKQHPKQ